jgi:hypothetical protein
MQGVLGGNVLRVEIPVKLIHTESTRGIGQQMTHHPAQRDRIRYGVSFDHVAERRRIHIAAQQIETISRSPSSDSGKPPHAKYVRRSFSSAERAAFASGSAGRSGSRPKYRRYSRKPNGWTSADLPLEQLIVLYPGSQAYELESRVRVLPMGALAGATIDALFPKKHRC